MSQDPGNPEPEPAPGSPEGPEPEGPPAEPPDWVWRDGLSLPQAQDLLDWLEANDVSERELTFHPAHGFTIRWHRRRRGGTSDPPAARRPGPHPSPREKSS